MNSKWDKKWFQLVDLVASWSKDPSTKVGAVIIPKDSDIPVFGWNGFARGVKDLPERYADRDIKYPLTVHAEENAVYNAGRNCVNIKGGTIYVSAHPCDGCANAIVQSGISNVLYLPSDAAFMERWKEKIEISRLILDEGGVIYKQYEA